MLTVLVLSSAKVAELITAAARHMWAALGSLDPEFAFCSLFELEFLSDFFKFVVILIFFVVSVFLAGLSMMPLTFAGESVFVVA
jgi:hypothetical protein